MSNKPETSPKKEDVEKLDLNVWYNCTGFYDGSKMHWEFEKIEQ